MIYKRDGGDCVTSVQVPSSALNPITITTMDQSAVWKWIASLGPPKQLVTKHRRSQQKHKRSPLAPVDTNVGRPRPGKTHLRAKLPPTTPPLELPDMRLRIGKPRDNWLKGTKPRDILSRYSTNTRDIFESDTSPIIKPRRIDPQFVIETPETYQHDTSRSEDSQQRSGGTFTASNNRCNINYLLN